MRSLGLLALLWLTLVPGGPTDWSRFRGPNGSGVGDDRALPTEFGRDRNVIWETPLPPGHSSPILSPTHAFVTAADGDDLVTIAIDRSTGRVAWRATAPRARQQRVDDRNNPASPSPATDGENVFVFFQDFGLLSYDAAGRERWRVPLGPFTNAYGMGASPIIVGDLVVLVCDQSIGSFMLAVGTDDGRVRWRVERPGATSGHSTPVMFEPASGPPQLLVPGSFYLSGYDAATGAQLWWAGGLAFEMKATPVHDGATVFISGTAASSFHDSYGGNVPAFAEVRAADTDGDGRFSREEAPDQLAQKWMRLLDLDGDGLLDEGEWNRYRAARRSAGGMWAFRLGGAGDVTDTHAVWHQEKGVPQLPSPLLYRGVLYLVNDGGIATAYDPETGAVLAQARLPDAADSYYASPVAADGKVFLVSELGKVVVLAADGSLRVLAVNDLDEVAYATPAIAGGRLYVRTRTRLYCFGLR